MPESTLADEFLNEIDELQEEKQRVFEQHQVMQKPQLLQPQFQPPNPFQTQETLDNLLDFHME